jgi:hypothetical protein
MKFKYGIKSGTLLEYSRSYNLSFASWKQKISEKTSPYIKKVPFLSNINNIFLQDYLISRNTKNKKTEYKS